MTDDEVEELAKIAHHAYHAATKDWVQIPSWNAPNALQHGWKAVVEAVRDRIIDGVDPEVEEFAKAMWAAKCEASAFIAPPWDEMPRENQNRCRQEAKLLIEQGYSRADGEGKKR